MAHFAKLGANGKVIQVLTLDNKDMLNADGVEDETVGQQYLERHNNWPAQMWIQTSYNTINNTHRLGGTPFRGNYAGIGYSWDEDTVIIKDFPKSRVSVSTSIASAYENVIKIVTNNALYIFFLLKIFYSIKYLV